VVAGVMWTWWRAVLRALCRVMLIALLWLAGSSGADDDAAGMWYVGAVGEGGGRPVTA